VERPADHDLLEGLLRGEFCHVLAPRQIGKSSLRARTARRLRDAGVRCASIDLTSTGNTASAEEWYFGLVDETAKRLGLADPIASWEKNRNLAPARRWRDYLCRLVSDPEDTRPLVVMIDEIEAVRLAGFDVDDFFTTMREIFERRADDADCRRLTFCLLGVTTPSDLIKDKLITPFNVSRGIRLGDFSRGEMSVLAEGLRHLGADSEALLDAVHRWTDGHPYMTMRICAALAESGTIVAGDEAAAVDQVIRREFLDRPLADPNLNYAANRFVDHERRFEHPGATLTDKVSLFRRVLKGERVPSELESALQMELRLSGMLKDVDEGGARVLRPRNKIFVKVFDHEWLCSQGNRRFISESVWKWLDSEKDSSYLLHGNALEQAVKWARTMPLSDDEEEFLAVSQRKERDALEQRRASVAEEVARSKAEADVAKRTVRWVVAVSIAIVVIAAFVIVQIARVNRIAASAADERAHKLAERMSQRFDLYRDAVELAAGRRDVQDALADAKAHPEWYDRERAELNKSEPGCRVCDKVCQTLEETPVTDAARDFQSWILFNKEGILLGRFPKTEVRNNAGLNYEWRDYFKGALQEDKDKGRPYVSRIFASEGDSDYKVGVSFPVHSSKGGAVIGLLLAQLSAGSSRGGFMLSDPSPPKGVVDVMVGLSDRGRTEYVPRTSQTFVVLYDGLKDGSAPADALLAEGAQMQGMAHVKDTPFTVLVRVSP
jgi:AAA-like domain